MPRPRAVRCFFPKMERVVPWAELTARIEPIYPKPGNGRPPVGLKRMLRIYFLQHGFNLSDPAVGEALYESVSMRAFVGIDLGREPVPDETTVCKFRPLLEGNDLGRHLQAQGLTVSSGTIVDATILSAPSSTKNQVGERDPEMRQTKKGNQWDFGMKAPIGVDSKLKLIHSVGATPANVHDSQALPQLLHGGETRVWGDSVYVGPTEVIRSVAPMARDFTQAKASRHRPLTEAERSKNRNKSKVRAKGAHPFLVIKRLFGFAQVCYRGIAKNANRLFVACALANLFLVRRTLLLAQQRCAP